MIEIKDIVAKYDANAKCKILEIHCKESAKLSFDNVVWDLTLLYTEGTPTLLIPEAKKPLAKGLYNEDYKLLSETKWVHLTRPIVDFFINVSFSKIEAQND